MAEIQLTELSPKSQKSRFGSVLVGEANVLMQKFQKKGINAPLEILEAHARSNIAHTAYENRLRRERDTDPLTGALSRRAIFEEIRGAIAEVNRKGGHIQVLFMDLKGLKQFNNTYGHETGDNALKYLVQGVRKDIRQYDEIGRYGGDEFLLLMKDYKPRLAHKIMSRLHITLSQLEEPYNTIRTVMGVANYSGKKSMTAEELVLRADQAFYFAKNLNINRPVIWNRLMKSIKVPK